MRWRRGAHFAVSSLAVHDGALFRGHDREIDQIVAVLNRPENAAAGISALNGMGGVGKTALAWRVADHPTVKARFPDSVAAIDMQGYSGAPLSVAPPLLTAGRRFDSRRTAPRLRFAGDVAGQRFAAAGG